MQAYTIPLGQHRLPQLPYPYNGLEPVISTRLLQIHHTQHHKSYVEGLNKAEVNLAESRNIKNFSLVKHWERELAFHGSGHILHSIFWTSMAPIRNRWVTPGAQTLVQINNYFGSFNAFQEQFSEAATNVEGSGWALLIWQPGWNRLEILAAEKHQDSLQVGSIPLLVLDLWEHAYYLDYQSKRKDFIKSWWQIVNWAEVEKRLSLAMQDKMPLTSFYG
jgi:Fe-Mn family superoxide dismutase